MSLTGLIVNMLQFKDDTELTLSSGAITPTQSYHTVAAESGTEDDLDTINLSSIGSVSGLYTYRPIIVLEAATGDTITIKHGTGNIKLNKAAGHNLTGTEKIMLMYDGTQWQDLSSSGVDIYTQQTTTATPTTVKSIAIAEDEAWFIKCDVVANKSDYSAALGVEMWGVFRRATSGNVTLVGSLQGTVQEDSGSAPSFTMTANTGTQSVDLDVTGVAAETWDWTVEVQFRLRA